MLATQERVRALVVQVPVNVEHVHDAVVVVLGGHGSVVKLTTAALVRYHPKRYFNS